MEKNNYVLLDSKGNVIGNFTGREPSKVAKKVARRGLSKIFLRQTGQKQIRVYKGSIEKKKLTSDTKWAKKGSTVNVGVSEYIGTATLQNGKLVVTPKGRR